MRTILAVVLALGAFIGVERGLHRQRDRAGHHHPVRQAGRRARHRRAGLHFKCPSSRRSTAIEKRILEWDGNPTEMPTKDKLYISVDTFARWRITDPLQYFLRLRDERSAQSRLDDILGSETRNAIAKHELIEIIRTTKDRVPLRDDSADEMPSCSRTSASCCRSRRAAQSIEQEIFAAAAEKLPEFGIELLDIRFKRINYNPSVRPKIYERMISERQQIAERFRSEGEGEAARILGNGSATSTRSSPRPTGRLRKIRGEADAKATEIYAGAYNQSPEAVEFYEFTQTMETYKAMIAEDTTLVLSTDSDLFKFLKAMDPVVGADRDGKDAATVIDIVRSE